MTRLWAFLQNVFAPGLHTAFAAAWFLSLLGTLILLRDPAPVWRFDLPLLLGVASLLVVLFYLRVVDEVKDYDYDLQHNPDRLLVQGAITHADLRRWGLGAALVVLALNAALAWLVSPWLLAIVVLDLLWAIGLIRLEAASAAVRDSMLLNLGVTYPVNVLMSVYVYVFFLAAYGASPAPQDAALIAAYLLVFLHYEFARKTAWPELTGAGERMYSNVLGGRGALAVVLGCAWGATGLALALLRPWEHLRGAPLRAGLGFGLLLLPLLTLRMAQRLLANRAERKKLGGLGMIGLTVFYAGLGLHALAANRLALGAP
ncbi:MAG: hypothetical protein AB7N76_18750 [Planctomycetota bacterium]